MGHPYSGRRTIWISLHNDCAQSRFPDGCRGTLLHTLVGTGFKVNFQSGIIVACQNRFHCSAHISFIPYPVEFSQRIRESGFRRDRLPVHLPLQKHQIHFPVLSRNSVRALSGSTAEIRIARRIRNELANLIQEEY